MLKICRLFGVLLVISTSAHAQISGDLIKNLLETPKLEQASPVLTEETLNFADPVCVNNLEDFRKALGIPEGECSCPTQGTWCGLRQSDLILEDGTVVQVRDASIGKGGIGLQLYSCDGTNSSLGNMYIRWLAPDGLGGQQNSATPVYEGCGQYGYPTLIENKATGQVYVAKFGPGPLSWYLDGKTIPVTRIIIQE